jgi:cytoskeletal protein CcmA (bactofilin family)
VIGDILAHERIDLGATAKVTGNVYYGLIEMAIGAEINGKLIHEKGKEGGGKRRGKVQAAPAPEAARKAEPIVGELSEPGPEAGKVNS